jgi:adenosylmethionine-8-amino-7-oxononanoate aminotransferase
MKKLNVFDTNIVDTSTPYATAYGHYIDDKFDLHAAGGANTFGYSHPVLTAAIKKEIDTSTNSFWKLKHSIWDQLSNKIDLITDNRYASYIPALTGSDAIDNAIKLMWAYWNDESRNIILIRKNSYHSGSISGWQMVYNQSFTSQWPQYKFVEFFDELEEIITQIGINKIAGVIIDTIPWGNGISDNSSAWWTNFQTTITKYNLLLCVDEVLTGVGRMGHWVHSHHLGLTPNIIVLGKALTAGHENLSLTILDDRITTAISNTWLAIGNTRSVNTMGAVVACAVIDLMLQDSTLDHINNVIIPYSVEISSMLNDYNINASAHGTIIQGLTDNIENIETKLNNNGLYHQWSCFWHLPFYNMSTHDMSKIKNSLYNSLK